MKYGRGEEDGNESRPPSPSPVQHSHQAGPPRVEKGKEKVLLGAGFARLRGRGTPEEEEE